MGGWQKGCTLGSSPAIWWWCLDVLLLAAAIACPVCECAEVASAEAAGSEAPQQPHCAHGKGVPALNPESVAFLAARGVDIKPLKVLGAEVFGMDLRSTSPESELLPVLHKEMAARGYIVFRGQGVLSGDQQVRASELFGGRQMHSTHGVHPQAPNEHIFRLSNDQQHGILGVGPQWHNDGSFVRAVFSHVGYHIVRVPEHGGATSFAHQGAAFDALPKEEQEEWERRVTVNSNSGVVHPLVHKHPISGKKSVWLHLGMTGAVLEKKAGVTNVTNHLSDLRLLDGQEMTALFNRYNDLMNNPAHSAEHHYKEGDCIFIDNLAVAHRATEKAHACASKQGLRILHRSTVKGLANFDAAPHFGLAAEIYIHGKSPYGQGIFQGGGTGFRWDSKARLQN